MSVATAAPNALKLLSITHRYFDLVSQTVEDPVRRAELERTLGDACSEAARVAESSLATALVEEKVADTVLRAVVSLLAVDAGSGALLLQVLSECEAGAHH